MKIKQILPAKPFEGWLKEWYGDHFAQISTDTTLRLKSAIKDVCRVLLGKVLPEIEEITKKLPQTPQGITDHNFVFGYDDSGNWVKGILETDQNLQEYVLKYPKHWAIVQKAIGLSRNKSIHACGVILADVPIIELGIPLTRVTDTVCTAFGPTAVEAMGGVKNDYLGVNSLKDIASCIHLLQNRNNIPNRDIFIDKKRVPACRLIPKGKTGELVDIWKLPEDQDVYGDICQGKTETVFQFSTSGATKWLKEFSVKRNGRWALASIKALATFTALDRPGPLDAYVRSGANEDHKHNMLVEYARRARKAEPSPDIFPFLDQLFPETFGILAFQESLQYAYQYITGCSGSEAEEFRRNVAKKKAEKILAVYPAFIERATAKLGSKENAEKAWGFLKTFASYGFSLNHSLPYVTISYACAYLKHHYPLEWWTAVLRNADKNEVNEEFWRYIGGRILLPDVSRSQARYEIVGDKIQAPLSLLHGIGEKAHEQLVAQGPSVDIQDFCNKIEAFKEAGAVLEKKLKKTTRKNRKTGETTEIVTEILTKKKRRSALTRGICYTLIVSGSMDSLFSKDLTTLDQLMAFEEALARSTGAKRVEAVPSQYREVNQLTRLQLRKSILPAYSAEILPMLLERRIPGIQKNAQRALYTTNKGAIPFVSPGDLDHLEALTPWPENETIRVAVSAYVETTRHFSWGSHKEKEALEVILDIDGSRKKFVRWGDRQTGKLSQLYKTSLDGSIVVGLLSKYKAEKPFNLDDLVIIEKPFKKEKEEAE